MIDLRHDDDVAAMQPRDLASDGQAKAGSLRLTRQPVKWNEHLFALGGRNAWSSIEHIDDGVAATEMHFGAHRRLAMPRAVVEKIADQLAQQTRIAIDGDGFALDLAIVVTRG